MLAIENIDKCTESFSIRIPEVLKKHIEKLSNNQKRHLNEEILRCIAHAVHDAQFDPNVYLRERKVKANDAEPGTTSFCLQTEEEA